MTGRHNIRTVNGIYFSATDTTKKIITSVADDVASGLQTELGRYSFSLPHEREKTLKFGASDLIILGVPVYAGRVPNLLLPWFREKITGKETFAVPVVLFGNRAYDDALIELRDLLENKGFRTIAAGAFVGEHSFSDSLAKGRPDADDMLRASELAKGIVNRINTIYEGKSRIDVPVNVKGNEPAGPYYRPRDRYGEFIDIRKVKPMTNMSKCTDCGICAAVCTMGAIDPDDVSNVPGTCTKCCACIKKCPENAKYFDDKGYLYHKEELEHMFSRRAEADLFFL